jgi:hypothetical protein
VSWCLIACVLMSAGAHADERRRKLGTKMMWAGGSLLVIGWTGSASWTIAGAAFHDVSFADGNHTPPPYDSFNLWNLLPVAGPWVLAGRMAAEIPQEKASGASDANAFNDLLPYLIPGLVQAAGACLLVAGAVVRKRGLEKLPTAGAQPLPGGALVTVGGRF